LRILLDYRPALRQRTGVGEYVHELARALLCTRDRGESLALFSSSWKDRLAPEGLEGAEVIDRRVPVRALNYAWHRLGRPNVERLTGQSFDVVQSAHPLLIPTSRAAQVVTICDLDFLDHPERTRAEIRRDYPALAHSHAARADRIVTISNFTAGEISRRLEVDPAKITIAFPGAPDWPRRPEEPRAGSLLFLGSLEPRKNLGVLLDAYERLVAERGGAGLPNLVLAGRAGAQAADLVARTKRAPLAGLVKVLGYVDAAERLNLFRDAVAFVLPSHTEGFGMPALEALTVGVPVVVANRGALPEVVGRAGRLFEADDAVDLARALGDVLTDAALRKRMRDAGWAQAQRFQWKDAAHQVREGWSLAVQSRSARG
jgi:glycosyltransferase involved in cell wall biosynthesis